MESERALIAAVIFILLIVGANFFMYAIVRGWAKGGESRWISSLRDSLRKPTESSSSKSMDELRKRVEELKQKKE